MPAATRSLNPFRVLVASRNFRLFWTGQTTSLIGTWMQSMAQGWLALELSDSAFLVGLVASIGSLPILLFSFYAGVIVDRYDKLKMVRIAQSLMLVEASLLWWFTWSGHITIGWLILLAASNGAFSAFEIPARQSLMVELVERDDLHDAIALNSSGFNLARIVGPSIAAVVIAKAGLAWCFGVNALSYLAVLYSLLQIQLPARVAATGERPSSLAGVIEGLRYMWSSSKIRALMEIVTVYSVFGVPYLTLMPVVARDMLHLDAAGYGVLLVFVGIGGLSGALYLASVGRQVRRGQLLASSSVAFAILLMVFSSVRSPVLARGVLLLTGFMMIINSALLNGMLQSIVPDEYRGRLMSTYSFVVVGLSSVFGALIAGAVARTVGVDWAIGGGATIMLAYALWAFGRYREIREM